MDKLIDMNKLYLCLKDIIENKKEVERVREVIIDLHFYIQKFILDRKEVDNIDRTSMESISMYLLSLLTNVTSEEMKKYIQDFYIEGLNIAGLIFELLADVEFEGFEKKHQYLFYSSVSYSLADKEASAAVIGKRLKSIIENDKIPSLDIDVKKSWIYICLTLSREFKTIYKDRNQLDLSIKLSKNTIWDFLNRILILNACSFVDGFDNEIIFENMEELKNFLIQQDDIETLFYISLLSEVLHKMHSKSVWSILPREGFTNEYIKVLTKYDSRNVYELWKSQLDALRCNNKGFNYLSENIKRVLISMPTSAGKSFVAELAIVKALQLSEDKVCIYVTPTRALMSEIESNLFYRLRKVGYNVTSVLDTDENEYENDLLNHANVLVVTPEKLDLLLRRHKEFIERINLIIFDEFHKVADNSRGWLLETLITWFMIKQQQYGFKIILMSAIVSNSEEVNVWLENDEFKPVVSEWTPSRRVYGVLIPDTDRTKYIRISDKKRQKITPYRLIYKYLERRRAIEDVITDIIVEYKNSNRRWKKSNNKYDTKYDRCFKFIKTLNNGKVLVYFFTKIDLERFIEYSDKYLPLKNDVRINKLKEFLESRLGSEHPLVNSILYGVAYHHGDLPIEVRKEIEKAYKSDLIDVLACTTTLSDGVNLPIKNFVLGSFTSYEGEHKLSIADFKNIVGRAGRAYIDTEGKIFLIFHPEYYFNNDNKSYFRQLLFCESQETNVSSSMIEEFDKIYSIIDQLEEVIEISIQDVEKSLLDFIDRLQVFIFSLYEEHINYINSYDDLYELLMNSLFAKQADDKALDKFDKICIKYYDFIKELDKSIIEKFNRTGLSFRSNRILLEIIDEISKNESGFDFRLQTIITPEIFEKIIELKEISPKQYYYKVGNKKVNYNIDHYKAFMSWISGDSFLKIRDSIFYEDNNISNRTQTCVNYINDMFLYKLPWAFSSLYALAKDSLMFADFILKDLPAKIKYGVENLEAVKLCTLGIESRELANTLAVLYENESSKDPEWAIDKWILEKRFYELEKSIKGIDDISIRQIARVRTKLRNRTSFLRDTGKIICDVRGLQFYDYFNLYSNKSINKNTQLLLNHEPQNLYDEFAIEVKTLKGEKIGYVPAEYSEEIFEYIQGDHVLKVEIIRLTARTVEIIIKVSN
ncbi:DEAD/DEAH box helicase [Acetivibrio clariflavus]|uniref:Superfamily II helicase n=1 Tax=Acetivibrio clariflavus (strain DSM 19732 / NBRC 101661 / EBR45) TaxID=720554 RepID=G8M1S8_ACECE|nr:DEAD/DEAH box helicase [Acetivibrio clariflavus]AEV67011.1 superfamily II helicase [Acetivibrio clariflavus DSM 19732]